MATHILLVNFRNPPDTVALLNKLFGQEMRAAKESNGEPSIKFISRTDEEVTSPALRMCFTHAASRSITEAEGNTVRSNQGGTSKDVKLYVCSLDGNTSDEPSLLTVALSRHTDSLTVILDQSDSAGRFRSLVDQGKTWMGEFKKHLVFPDIEKPVETESDPMITRVIAGLDSDNLSASSSDEDGRKKLGPLIMSRSKDQRDTSSESECEDQRVRERKKAQQDRRQTLAEAHKKDIIRCAPDAKGGIVCETRTGAGVTVAREPGVE